MPDREAYIGRSLRRTEDPKLITGRGQYVEDITLPGLAHLVKPVDTDHLRTILAELTSAVVDK